MTSDIYQSGMISFDNRLASLDKEENITLTLVKLSNLFKDAACLRAY